MYQAFEGTIDSHGHIDLPEAVRNHHGFRAGMRVRIEDRESEVVIRPAMEESERKRRALAAIEASVGLLGTDRETFEWYLEQKRRDRESEDRDLHSR